MKIKPGKYTGEIIDSGVSETKSGKPQAWIKFRLDTGDTFTHYMTITDKSANMHAKTLVRAGFLGTDFSDLGKPTSFVAGTQLKITFKAKEYTDKNGTKQTTVEMNWAEPIGTAYTAKPYTGKMQSFAKIFVEKRKELGVTAPTPNFDDELPF